MITGVVTPFRESGSFGKRVASSYVTGALTRALRTLAVTNLVTCCPLAATAPRNSLTSDDISRGGTVVARGEGSVFTRFG